MAKKIKVILKSFYCEIETDVIITVLVPKFPNRICAIQVTLTTPDAHDKYSVLQV